MEDMQRQNHVFKMVVGRGNNQQLIRSLFRQRWWWQIIEESKRETKINLLWTQNKQNKQIDKIKRNNNEKQRETITIQKAEGIKTLRNAFKKDKMFQKTEVLLNQEQKKLFEKGDKNEIDEERMSLVIKQNNDIQMHNHLECNYNLSNKKALFYNLSNYMRLLDKDPFTIIPLTFHIIKTNEQLQFDEQFTQFVKIFEQNKQEQQNDKTFNNVWIIKPGESTNRGKGIQVSNNLEEIISIVNSSVDRNQLYQEEQKTWIIQKYMENPLLFWRRKFDIRCFFLLNTQNNQLKGYWYTEGYIRTSSQIYQCNNFKNKQIHLTNDAIQKRSDDYGKFENGNKVSFGDFEQYLLDKTDQKVSFMKQIYPKMKEIAQISIESVYKSIDPQRTNNTFEIFGLDFMIDSLYEPTLIEINTNPDLETCCSLLYKLIPQMLENSIRLAVDPFYPPPNIHNCKIRKIYIPNNVVESNNYELIFDEEQDKERLNKVFSSSKSQNGITNINISDDEEFHD